MSTILNTYVANAGAANNIAASVLLSLDRIAPLVSHEGLNLTPEEKADTYGDKIVWGDLTTHVMPLWSPLSGKGYFITNHPRRGLQCSCQGNRRRQGQHYCWHLLSFLREWGGIVTLQMVSLMPEVQA